MLATIDLSRVAHQTTGDVGNIEYCLDDHLQSFAFPILGSKAWTLVAGIWFRAISWVLAGIFVQSLEEPR